MKQWKANFVDTVVIKGSITYQARMSRHNEKENKNENENNSNSVCASFLTETDSKPTEKELLLLVSLL